MTFFDEAGRLVTATGTVYLVMQKMVLREGPKMESEKVGELAALERLRVLRTETINVTDVDEGVTTAVKRGWVCKDGTEEPLGWVSFRSKKGTDMLLPVDDPRAVKRLEEGTASPGGKSAADGDESDDADGAIATRAPPSGPPPTVLLAHSGSDVARVSEQNFGSAAASLPLTPYHFPMVNDVARNEAFASSLVRAVAKSEPSLVLDIGSGTGLLAMLAAHRARAPRVLAIEMTPELATIAQKLVDRHGLAESVRVRACHSSEVELHDSAEDPWQRKAELLVFEILGTDPLCEGVLPALKDARERLLAPWAVIMPCCIEVHVVLVSSEELSKLNSIRQQVGGINMGALNALSHRTRAIRLSELKHDLLTEPQVALRLQLDAEEPPALKGETELELNTSRNGVAHALVAWFSAHLDGSGRPQSTISTAPGVAEPMRGHSWGQCAHFLPAPLEVTKTSNFRLRTRWSEAGLSFSLTGLSSGSTGLKGVGTAEMSSRLQEQLAQIDRNIVGQNLALPFIPSMYSHMPDDQHTPLKTEDPMNAKFKSVSYEDAKAAVKNVQMPMKKSGSSSAR